MIIARRKKRRRSADVFARLKSFGRAFSKARAGEGGARLLAVATAKFLGGVSFC